MDPFLLQAAFSMDPLLLLLLLLLHLHLHLHAALQTLPSSCSAHLCLLGWSLLCGNSLPLLGQSYSGSPLNSVQQTSPHFDLILCHSVFAPSPSPASWRVCTTVGPPERPLHHMTSPESSPSDFQNCVHCVHYCPLCHCALCTVQVYTVSVAQIPSFPEPEHCNAVDICV